MLPKRLDNESTRQRHCNVFCQKQELHNQSNIASKDNSRCHDKIKLCHVLCVAAAFALIDGLEIHLIVFTRAILHCVKTIKCIFLRVGHDVLAFVDHPIAIEFAMDWDKKFTASHEVLCF